MDHDDNIRKLDKLLNKIKEAARGKTENKNATSNVQKDNYKNEEIDGIYRDIDEIICALDKKYSELESVGTNNKKKEKGYLNKYIQGHYIFHINVEIKDCSG